MTQAVSEAAAQGDRSENAEYTYGKRRLREIDRRVRFLRKRLDGMVIVDQPPADRRRGVSSAPGSPLESDDGAQSRYRIVGPDEFDMAPGYISMDSPLGRALLRRSLDDEVTVELPGGQRARCVIVEIEYGRRRVYQTTRTFLNCQGSLLSRSSGNSRSRSCSGVQSV